MCTEATRGPSDQAEPRRRRLPSITAVLAESEIETCVAAHGRDTVLRHARAILAEARSSRPEHMITASEVAAEVRRRAGAEARLSQRPVLNLTGTVLHTNLGRAVLAEAAREAVLTAMSGATNLEYDLETGARGERDDHVRTLLTDLTGAEDAIVVNNNAAAVILVLNTLGEGRDSIVSRGELVEIGGSFRMPDIMARAGTRLVEVGTTNRTHLRDYEAAITERTGLLLKVHPSNYELQGFVASVPHAEVAALARSRGLPFVDDLGSGALIDIASFGLPHERTIGEALRDGADLVTASGDKLLGGPQVGIIVGRRDLVRRLARNPLKRALRLDRLRLAALEATLRLYRDPARLAERLPTVRFLSRPLEEIRALAAMLEPGVASRLGPGWRVSIAEITSEVGSGALPTATMPSAGLAIAPAARAGMRIEDLAAALRRLPLPIIGRICEGRIILDLRCLLAPEPLLAALATGPLP